MIYVAFYVVASISMANIVYYYETIHKLKPASYWATLPFGLLWPICILMPLVVAQMMKGLER